MRSHHETLLEFCQLLEPLDNEHQLMGIATSKLLDICFRMYPEDAKNCLYSYDSWSCELGRVLALKFTRHARSAWTQKTNQGNQRMIRYWKVRFKDDQRNNKDFFLGSYVRQQGIQVNGADSSALESPNGHSMQSSASISMDTLPEPNDTTTIGDQGASAKRKAEEPSDTNDIETLDDGAEEVNAVGFCEEDDECLEFEPIEPDIAETFATVPPPKFKPFEKKFSNKRLGRIPPLNTKEMREYARKEFEARAPKWLKPLLHDREFSPGLNVSETDNIFITKEIREHYDQHGWAVVKDVFSQPAGFLDAIIQYIHAWQRCHGYTKDSYKQFSGPRYTLGLKTKHGWNKDDYFGLPQQCILSHPNFYQLASELYGNTRLVVNPYEYKYCFGRPEERSRYFEFFHADVNYPELLFAEQLGIPVEKLMYQFLVAGTPMKPEGATLWVADGFVKHWKDATYNALVAGYWNRWGYQTCRPNVQFLPHDVKTLIEARLVPMVLEPGDLLILSPFTPHGPNINCTTDTRIAWYPYVTPGLGPQSETNPTDMNTYMPNPLKAIAECSKTWTCAEWGAHPYCSYLLSALSRNFFPLLEPLQLPLTLIAECLFGWKPWILFERSEIAANLFGSDSVVRNETVQKLQEPLMIVIRKWTLDIITLLEKHRYHRSYEEDCKLCCRIRDAKLVQWWHSNEAVIHRSRKRCCCNHCTEVRAKGWRFWKEKGGCTCPLCVGIKEAKKIKRR